MNRTTTDRYQLAHACILASLLGGCGVGPDSPAARSYPLTGPLLTHAVKIGEPYRSTAGGSLDPRTCYARSIWDMQRFNGRIFLGAGDSYYNSGRTTVWSFAETDGTVTFQQELVVDEEVVRRFRSYGGKLYIPGIDSTESWDLGNFYVNDGGGWTKRRTVPGGVHVYDIAELGGRLFSFATDDRSQGHVFVSDDQGQSWLTATKGAAYGLLVPLEDSLAIFGEKGRAPLYLYQDGRTKAMRGTICAGTWDGRPTRTLRYQDQLLYVVAPLPFLEPAGALLSLRPTDAAPQVQHFGGAAIESVRDIVVAGSVVYVMTARKDGPQYLGTIYGSTDATTWTKRGTFTVPAPPHSFEQLDGTFYVGLGTEGTVYSDTTAETEAGSIWRLE